MNLGGQPNFDDDFPVFTTTDCVERFDEVDIRHTYEYAVHVALHSVLGTLLKLSFCEDNVYCPSFFLETSLTFWENSSDSTAFW